MLFVLGIAVQDSDGKRYSVSIIGKSSGAMPSLAGVAQTDEAEAAFWELQVGKLLCFGVFQPNGTKNMFAEDASIVES